MTAADLASRLGLHRAGTAWRGSCPVCGYGADAFALTSKGGWTRGFCASCGDKEAIATVLLELKGGGAIQRPPAAPAPTPNSLAQRTAAALGIWSGAVPAAGTAADVYLTRRALPGLANSAALRWHPDVAHPSGGGIRYPAMLALVVDVNGAPLAVHRTYIDRYGRKADLSPVKASKGPVGGGAIRLDPVAPELLIAEGIETAASAGRLMGLPAWAAVSAGNMERTLQLPPEVRSVVVAADPDPAGRSAAEGAARRWMAEGRRVRIAVPNTPPHDFNDLLRERALA